MASRKTLQFNKDVFTRSCPDQNISVTAVHDEGKWYCFLYYYRRTTGYLVRIVILARVLDQLIAERGITSANELVDEVVKCQNNIIRFAVRPIVQHYCGCLEECFCEGEGEDHIRQYLSDYNALRY